GGGDARVEYRLTERLAARVEGSLVRGRDLDRPAARYLQNIPADRAGASLTYEGVDRGALRGGYVTVGYTYVRRQDRQPLNAEGVTFLQNQPPPLYQDFAAAPPAYGLMRLALGGRLGERLDGTLTVDNLLNTDYRGYLNRLRYYAADVGRNATLRLRWSF
ncbi:MAG: hypothetical protein WBA12_14245, partial [Catalinimonas sp.]